MAAEGLSRTDRPDRGRWFGPQLKTRLKRHILAPKGQIYRENKLKLAPRPSWERKMGLVVLPFGRFFALSHLGAIVYVPSGQRGPRPSTLWPIRTDLLSGLPLSIYTLVYFSPSALVPLPSGQGGLSTFTLWPTRTDLAALRWPWYCRSTSSGLREARTALP